MWAISMRWTLPSGTTQSFDPVAGIPDEDRELWKTRHSPKRQRHSLDVVHLGRFLEGTEL
jgi:hypothetical protein